MNKIIILTLSEQKWTKVDKTRHMSHFVHFFISKGKRKPMKSMIRIWHSTCNIKDEQENRRAGHVKNN
ncbi:hypothetical protein COJ27_15295 [Bacillus cereus]|uniref:Uncharacterized protein n=1 Tax=Bacillus cereus TaxID=1396 RepID=A0A9X6VQ31_BACCE|nr:hypothetical protein CN284_10025 [Bacillus cereus]PFD24851.1 hypothetical protein CN263_03690 [Bacillus cereus]PFL63179.1 hypothetical protein COJ27_15295 [Bacillus cereus]PGW62678.1 hypothetical protein COE18_09415 [Bacillus cereus]